MFETINLFSVLVASIVVFLFGCLWYSPILFSKAWMDAVGKGGEDPAGSVKDMPKVLAFGYVVSLVSTYALAVIFAMVTPVSLISALETSIFICFSFIITTKFADMLYQSREPHWSKRPQLIFLISSGYYLGSMIIATEILWFFANSFNF